MIMIDNKNKMEILFYTGDRKYETMYFKSRYKGPNEGQFEVINVISFKKMPLLRFVVNELEH